MSKRGADQRDEIEFAYHEETGSDGTSFKVGCDCFEHAPDIDWIQCTDCDIWFCIKAVIDEYDLNKQELQLLMKDDHLFKCRLHEIPELDLKQCLKDSLSKTSNIPYNLRKRSKPSPELPDLEIEDDVWDFTDIHETKEEEFEASESHQQSSNDDDIFDQIISSHVDINQNINKPRRKKAPKRKAPKKKQPKKKPAGNFRKMTLKGKAKKDKGLSTRKQMDMIRYQTLSSRKIDDVKGKLIDVNRRLGKYLRNDAFAKQLVVYVTDNMKKKGRTFGAYKEDQVSGGWNCRWSTIELQGLLYSLLFIFTYGGVLRYDFASAPIQKSNVKITKRVYEGMMVLEELDILYLKQVKARNEKAIKDKMALCAKFEINDPADGESIIGKIHCVLIEKFEYKKFEDSKEPSSVSEALAESQRQQEIKKANREKYKALRTKPANETNQKINAVLDYLIAKENKENTNSNTKDTAPDSDEDIDNALRQLGVLNEEKGEKEKANQDKEQGKKSADDEDSDIEQIENKNCNKKKLENAELIQDVMNSSQSSSSGSPTSSINNNKGVSSFYGGSAINPHSQTPIYHTQRLYEFIDKVTGDGEMDDDDKQALTLAFYDETLKADIIPYFDSLCIQNKTFPEMAASLLFLVKCLKKNKR